MIAVDRQSIIVKRVSPDCVSLLTSYKKFDDAVPDNPGRAPAEANYRVQSHSAGFLNLKILSQNPRGKWQISHREYFKKLMTSARAMHHCIRKA